MDSWKVRSVLRTSTITIDGGEDSEDVSERSLKDAIVKALDENERLRIVNEAYRTVLKDAIR